MDVIMPQLGETVAEGKVTRWYKKIGDPVKADEALFDVETDKVSTEIPAPVTGVLAEILVAEGATAKVGVRLAVIRESAPRQASGGSEVSAAALINKAVPGATPATMVPPTMSRDVAPATPPERKKGPGAGDRLSPVVRRLLAEQTLNPAAIAGTGRDGRITREDVLAHIAQRGAGKPAGAGTPAAAAPGTEPLNSVRRRTAEHVAKSWTTIPHVLQVVEADFSRVDEARRGHGEAWKKREGFSLTYLPFVAWAVSRALARYPRLNASFSGDSLVLHQRINLGIAVDLNFEGLLVPVVKDATAKSLADLARAINDLAGRARGNRLKPDDMTEGTYTLTNNGAYGTLITAPVISPPQVAILSTDSIRKRPVVIEGPGGDTVAIRPVGMLAQTFDHRAVDGAYAAAFLKEVKTLIESRDWTQELR